jgi:hypothetical protein
MDKSPIKASLFGHENFSWSLPAHRRFRADDEVGCGNSGPVFAINNFVEILIPIGSGGEVVYFAPSMGMQGNRAERSQVSVRRNRSKATEVWSKTHEGEVVMITQGKCRPVVTRLTRHGGPKSRVAVQDE